MNEYLVSVLLGFAAVLASISVYGILKSKRQSKAVFIPIERNNIRRNRPKR
jgi:hypothetical protein